MITLDHDLLHKLHAIEISKSMLSLVCEDPSHNFEMVLNLLMKAMLKCIKILIMIGKIFCKIC